jgi:hypothetical protein
MTATTVTVTYLNNRTQYVRDDDKGVPSTFKWTLRDAIRKKKT